MLDRLHIIHLRSYGFLHPGRERWKTRVIKGSWDVIPGSTLYGALAAALIKLDCSDPTAEVCGGACGYHRLLEQIKRPLTDGVRLRFSPLISADEEIRTAGAYCLAGGKVLKQRSFLTTPHAPIDRNQMSIHGDLLYGVRSHPPFRDYYGFIAVASEQGDLTGEIRRALRLLPFLPFGGRGKFAQVEGELVDSMAREQFLVDLAPETPRAVEAVFLTPMILRDGGSSPLLAQAEVVALGRLRRYRVWRQGWYPIEGEFKRYEPTPGPEGEGCQSLAFPGIREGSRLRLSSQGLRNAIIDGVGHPEWTCFGWGQVIIDESAENKANA